MTAKNKIQGNNLGTNELCTENTKSKTNHQLFNFKWILNKLEWCQFLRQSAKQCQPLLVISEECELTSSGY